MNSSPRGFVDALLGEGDIDLAWSLAPGPPGRGTRSRQTCAAPLPSRSPRCGSASVGLVKGDPRQRAARDPLLEDGFRPWAVGALALIEVIDEFDEVDGILDSVEGDLDPSRLLA